MKPGNEQRNFANPTQPVRKVGFDTGAFNRAISDAGGGDVVTVSGARQGWQGGDVDSGELPGWSASLSVPEDDADNDFDYDGQ